MLTDAVIAPLTKEDDTFEDVDPEEGHEENPATSQWVTHKNSPQKRPRYDALIPTKSLRLNKKYLLAGSSIIAQHYFDKLTIRQGPSARSMGYLPIQDIDKDCRAGFCGPLTLEAQLLQPEKACHPET